MCYSETKIVLRTLIARYEICRNMMVVVDGRDPGWNENRSAAECNNRREGACPDTSLTETEKGTLFPSLEQEMLMEVETCLL